jgi:hypothetical protein
MDNPRFADDTPRQDPQTEDDFGYATFAKRLADVVLQMDAPKGYVVGVHGAWGAGKTTALNFVRHYVETEHDKKPDRPLEVLWFSPWIVSGHQDLVSAFFHRLTETLKAGSEARRKAKKAAQKGALMAVNPLAKAAAKVAAAAHPPEATAIRVTADLAAAAMKQRIDVWLGEPTLETAYNDLVALLEKSRRRFLIFVDDIDRLPPAEIRTVLQMIKSVGRLPNVIYLLAYDRRILLRATGEDAGRQAGEPTFAEKIVQHEVELPHVGRTAISSAMDKQLRFILDHIQGGSRWWTIVGSGLNRWIRYPRDIVRLANAVRFAWPPLQGEVDAGDVLAMEGMRLFESDVYDWVRRSRDFLIEPVGYVTDEENKARGTAVRDLVGADRSEDVVKLLAVLFGSRAKFLKADDRLGLSGGEVWAEVMKRGGIATARGYDAYFALDPQPNTLPKTVVDAAAAAPNDLDVQEAALRVAMEMTDGRGNSLIGDYLDELQARFATREPIPPTSAIFTALFKAAPFVLHQERKGALLLPPVVSLDMLLHEILERVDRATADKMASEAVRAVGSAETAAWFYVWRAREAGRIPADSEQAAQVISEAVLDEIGQFALERVLLDAAEGRLAASAVYFDIMRTWTTLGSADDAKVWLTKVTSEDAHVLSRATKGILASTSANDGSVVYLYRGLGRDRDYLNPTALLAACEAFSDAADLSDDERHRITTLRDGLRKALAEGGDLVHAEGDD